MGIHHVTAIAGDPQRNLDFYAGVLGLRLVKLTVNFDDPGSYHLYYGDEIGRPGTILTFFPWPGGQRGRQGAGQIATVGFATPPAALGFWIERLISHGISYEGPTRRFDEQVLAFSDPDGLLLELVATASALGTEPWSEGPVPPEQAVRGLHGATIWEDGDSGTGDFLRQVMGLTSVGEDGGLLRYAAEGSGAGLVVNLRRAMGFWRGAGGVGTIHHMAFRAASDEEQLAKRAEIESRGFAITPVIDRQYFHSVYFREPGGVLFEIATDGPGFAIDESVLELGNHLKLPPMYEPNRERIERVLPPLRLPHAPAGEGR
jgi:catechol 2,3-dioxygenase-like lactoylglutathione lyase family enzyme